MNNGIDPENETNKKGAIGKNPEEKITVEQTNTKNNLQEHGKMENMDQHHTHGHMERHQQMDHGHMSGMDHSHMDHEDMSGMNHSHMGHENMGGMDHSMHMGNFKQKFWLSLILAIPIILFHR